MLTCQNNFEKSYTEEKTKPASSGYSIFTSCLIDSIKKFVDCRRFEDCIERFCKDLREHAMKKINFENKNK